MGGYILEDGRKLQTDEYIEHLEAQRDQALKERDQLLSKIKQHRNATESRLRMLNGREASDTMLKPDRDLYTLANSIEQDASTSPDTAPQNPRDQAGHGELQAGSKPVQNLELGVSPGTEVEGK